MPQTTWTFHQTACHSHPIIWIYYANTTTHEIHGWNALSGIGVGSKTTQKITEISLLSNMITQSIDIYIWMPWSFCTVIFLQFCGNLLRTNVMQNELNLFRVTFVWIFSKQIISTDISTIWAISLKESTFSMLKFWGKSTRFEQELRADMF